MINLKEMNKKFIFVIGIVLFSSYSCKKSLLTPVSQTSVAAVGGAPFATLARIQAQVLGLYTTIRNGQSYGGRYQIYNDVKADNWINATANSVTAYQTWTSTVNSTSSEVINLWGQCYLSINNCNLFIDGMQTYGTAVAGAALSANYVAEAKFIRAINYYALLNMYCQPFAVNAGASPGVPLRLTGNSSYGDFALAPSTVAQVYAQIIKDLNDAETALPPTYSDAATITTRAHRNTAIAFKTRVYLAMQQYTNVITEANKIVSTTAPFTATSGVPNALQASIANVFKTYTTTESILSMPFTLNETVGTQNAFGGYYNSVGSAEFHLNPEGVIADAKWKTTDARRAFISFVTAKGHSYLTKWPLAAPYIDWANLMRYPEVLLNLAEARVRSTNAFDAQAIALLNAVRQRSDATTTFTAAGFTGGVSDLTAAILQERNIEFLGEGLRWNDLWRLQLPIPAKGGVTAIPVSSASYIWPMSGNEQQYNSLIGR